MASLTSAGNTPTTSTSHSTSHSTKSKETNVPEVPLVFVTNNQFDDYTRDVFERPISVEGFRNAELINNEEYELLSKYKAARSSRNYKIEEPAAFVNILVAMLGRISRVELVLYLLVIIDELLDINPDVADAFISKLKQSPSTLYQPFLRCLRKDDKFLGLKSCKILVGFLRRSPVEEAKKFPYTKTFSFLAESLKSDKTSIQDVSIQLIRSILQVSYSRAKLFEESSNCLHELVVLFKNTEQHPNHFQGSVPASQLQYGAVLCLWLLSFDKTIASKLNKIYDIIPTMTEVARTAVKEKVIRVIVATWKNLVDLAPQNNLSFIADSNTVECLYSIKGRKLKDDDLKTDIGELVEYIKEKQAHMSTWDFYANEIESGRLNWTPAHRDEAFWKLHAEKLDENNFRIIRGLHSILESNSDPLSVAIACNDIGQYIHFNTKGKQIIKRLGTKKLVLAHMLNEDPGVKYEALMAAQQLMKHAWEN